ncbi:glycosyl hydrolase [Mucilaginibacter agri]|uniref:Asl1-like glycosyl hydrolase catalytic domain-containing protein n=1 Tax=Mucilaginibacter agri TaxID=2695265 RepID=A0A965ZFT7_9SPHI|nr:glycosyl hydrolase [Mucilaginibacter agri]NCD70140.1 hypothetical protein [Mucilaginibacter agri]
MHFKKSPLLFLFALTFIFSCKKDDQSSLVTPSNPSDLDVATTTLSSVNAFTSVKATSGKAYTTGTLSKDSTYYIDRTNKFTAVPDSLSGAAMVKTANDDKANTSSSFLSFTLSSPATVYVGYDARATAVPAWLSGWTKLSATLGTDDAKMGSFVLYSKAYNAGSVILGGTMAPPAAGAQCQYVVFAKANTTVVASPSAQIATSSQIFGVNGHSLGSDPYLAVGIDQQIALLKQMGMTYYRQDISFKTDGTISSLSSFIPIFNVTKAAGITILPMVYSTTLDLTKSETDNYNAGRLKGSAVASQNSQYFKYYELGNELDNKVILSGNGDKSTDYDLTKFKLVAAYLKGMDDGIKSAQPTAKTMINASWLHFAYTQMLIDYGVNFDIVAWHWYSDMEAAGPGNSMKVTDIAAKLASLFSKPIWFTEVGERYKNVANIEQLQSDFITSFVKKVKTNPNVGAVLLYELFDEPQKSSNALEANYGLIKWTSNYTKWQVKTVVNNLTVN